MKIKCFILVLGVISNIIILGDYWVRAEGVENNEIKGNLQMVPNLDSVDPLDPTDPNCPTHPTDCTNTKGPEYSTGGPLSIDFASSIVFGRNRISNKDMTYFANPQHIVFDNGTEKEVPDYVQVTDHRGSNAGWQLQVKQEHQLESSAPNYKVLKGAEIRLSKMHAVSNQSNVSSVDVPDTPEVVLIPGKASDVMRASQGSGGGTWIDVFGELQKVKVDKKNILKNPSVSLSIPGKTPKDAVTYRSSLTWTLIDSP